jgi:hypothetical protein
VENVNASPAAATAGVAENTVSRTVMLTLPNLGIPSNVLVRLGRIETEVEIV